MKKNKTYRYLFRPMLAFFFSSEIFMNFEQMKILNVYLQDKAEEGSTTSDPILFILVDTKGGKFNRQLKVVQESHFFMGIHLIGKYPPRYAVITFRCLGGTHFNNFLKSQYSKMYSKEKLNSHRNKFKVKLDDGTFGFSKEYKVMTNDPDYRKEVIAWTGVDDPKLVTELASKWVEENETFNSETIEEELKNLEG